MDSPLPAVLPIPRLRLSRHANLYETAVAGPSRSRPQDAETPASGLANAPSTLLDNFYNNSDDDDDEQPTPKMTTTATLIESMETPAARLRALLSRTPTVSKPTPMPHPQPYPSDNESDFDPPNGMPTNTPSIARESLKDIFSRALRDPGNTPQKQKNAQRRNSIDVSEVEASPRVQQEREKNKGKRKSLSDEELENHNQRSETSFRSSQAATYDFLRERLTNSRTQLKDQHLSDGLYDDSSPYNDSSDAAEFLRNVNPITNTPPQATSTPQQSLRMSTNSQFPFQSNLMEQDSEMQRAIEGLDSFEADGPSQRPVSFPPSRSSNPETQHQSSLSKTPRRPQSPSRTQSPASHLKSRSFEKLHGTGLVRRASEELLSASRASPSPSTHKNPDRTRDREREWNKPKTPNQSHTPELHNHTRGSLSRRGSVNSLRNYDDDSSKGSSFGSQADYRERVAELERERNIEREREWNKRHPNLSRPTSSLSLHSPTPSERSRTYSQPTRPESAELPHLNRHLQRHHSFSNSSRASSPAHSLSASNGGKEESEEEEVIHERERNWNAPRPKWSQHEHSYGPSSPSRIPGFSPTANLSNGRMRTQSLKSSATRNVESPDHRRPAASHKVDDIRRSATPSPRPSSPLPSDRRNSTSSAHEQSPSSSPRGNETRSRNHSFALRPRSPLTNIGRANGKGKEVEKDRTSNGSATTDSPKSQPKHTPSHVSGSGLHAGFSFVRNRTVLPPIEKETPERPVQRAPRSSLSPIPNPPRTPNFAKPSGIPVRSPKKDRVAASGQVKTQANTTREPSYVDLSRSEPSSRLNVTHHQNFYDNDESDHNDEDLAQERTPTLRTIPPPLETPDYAPPRSPSPPPRQMTPINDQSRLEKALGLSNTAIFTSITDIASPGPTTFQELSPPPSPPKDPSPRHPEFSSHSFLATPPRRPSFTITKPEFRIPSPPKDFPELPEAPLTSEDDYEDTVHERSRTPVRDLRSDLTAMKTPRPPGGWANTPAPSRRNFPELSPSSHEIGGESQEQDHAQTPIRDLRFDETSTKTPRPPGAWASTPAPSRQEWLSETRSLSGNTDDDHESGLATPVPSLSRASPMPPQTPAPPGAWTATPAARKSIMRVRFDTQAASSDTSPTADVSHLSESQPNEPSKDLYVVTDMSTPYVKEEESSRTHTPEPPTPVSPVSNRSPSRKSPGIRILDAFGREVPKEKATPRNKSGIRVVDAMGRDVKELSVEVSADISIAEEQPAPLKRGDALAQMRQNLSDLAEGMNDIDRANHDSRVDYARLRDLNDASRAARAARQQLSHTLSLNEADLRSKMEPLRASMKKSRFLIPAAVDRRISMLQTGPWMFWGVLFLQFLLVLIMYRASLSRARQLFLTTYYDPFYADLHLYTLQPDTLRLSISSPDTSWTSIPHTLRHEGWKASLEQIWVNLSMTIGDWQKVLWESYGTSAVPQSAAWPPT